MGQEMQVKATLKGHGFGLGAEFLYAGRDSAPTVGADIVKATKDGVMTVLTVSQGRHAGMVVARVGAATKFWGAPLPQATEPTEAPQAATVATDVEVSVTDHGFSAHSRRPWDCRICKRGAQVHTYASPESQVGWLKANTVDVTARMAKYGERTLSVVKLMAAQGGSATEWDLGKGRGLHATAVKIVKADGIIENTTPGLGGTWSLTAVGRQLCLHFGIEIAGEVKSVDAMTYEELIESAEAVALDASDIAEANAQAWAEAGSPRDDQGQPDIPSEAELAAIMAEHDAAMAAWLKPLLPAIMPALPVRTPGASLGAWDLVEAEIWAGTDLVEPMRRTRLSRKGKRALEKAFRADCCGRADHERYCRTWRPITRQRARRMGISRRDAALLTPRFADLLAVRVGKAA